MKLFSYWLSIVSNSICILTLLGFNIILYVKTRALRFLLLCMGISIIGFGSLYRLFFNWIYSEKLTFSEFERIVSSGSLPLSWYFDSVIINCGLLLVTIGFALIVFRKKKTSEEEENKNRVRP